MWTSGGERARREKMDAPKPWCRLLERQLPADKLLITFVLFCLQNLVFSKGHTLQQSTHWTQVTQAWWYCALSDNTWASLLPHSKSQPGQPCLPSALSWSSHNFPVPPPPYQARPSPCHPARALHRLPRLYLPSGIARLPLLLWSD